MGIPLTHGNTASRAARSRRTPRWLIVVVVLLSAVGLFGLTACAPPALVVESPFFGTATQTAAHTWEGNLLACASGGGVVTVAVSGGFDPEHPYRVDIYDAWSGGNLIGSGGIGGPTEVVTSSPLALGGCFRVRVHNDLMAFFYSVTWCSGECTTVPSAPTIASFAPVSGPYTAPALVPFGWSVRDRNPDAVVSCRLDADGDGTWDLQIPDCDHRVGTNVLVGPGQHTARLEVSDGIFPPVVATAPIEVGPDPVEPYGIEVRHAAPLPPEVEGPLAGVVAQWERVISRGVPDQQLTVPASYCGTGGQPVDQLVDDIVIDILVGPLDGRGGTGGTAGSCAPGPDRLPRLGLIIIDEADIPFLDEQAIYDLVSHEFGHALGFGADRFFDFVSGGDTDGPTFTGPRARVEWAALGGLGDPPLHPHNFVHWRDPDLAGEVMNNGLRTVNVLSILTVAAFADFGYHVDPEAADPYVLGG